MINSIPLYGWTTSITDWHTETAFCFSLCNHVECNRDRTGGVLTRVYQHTPPPKQKKVNRFGLPVLAQAPTVAVEVQPATPDPLKTGRNLAGSLAPRLPCYRTRKGEP